MSVARRSAATVELSKELVARLAKLPTAHLSDVMGKIGAMDSGIRPVCPGLKMVGSAYTVRVHSADLLAMQRALAEAKASDVLVIDGHGDCNTALWGELTSIEAKLKGVAGLVVDGAVRDVADIRRVGFPVFARSIVPNAGGAEYLGEINVLIQCGGLPVHPGDVVVGDDDGVVVIPEEQALEVTKKAELLVALEERMKERLYAGGSLAEMLGLEALVREKEAAPPIPQMRVKG